MNEQGQQVLIFKPNTKREFGRSVQLSTIQASKAVSEIVRTTLGPRAMLKMLIDPMDGIVITNDGNAILREIDVANPAAKSLIELSRSQDEEVGDGTTSAVILAGQVLSSAEPLIKREMHPTVIISGFTKALSDAQDVVRNISTKIDVQCQKSLENAVSSCLDTKFSSRWGKLICDLSIKSALTVQTTLPNGKKSIDLKRYAKIEKIPGGNIEDSRVLDGIMINKDVTHGQMKRVVENPKILILDCTLEYKKGESQTNVEITKEEDWAKLLEQEELEVKTMCQDIITTGCNVVVTEKGVSDLAQHYLLKAGISVLRRVRKSDANRLARACGATIVNRTEEALEKDLGLKCKLFQVNKIGDDYYSFFTKCQDPKACTILLRGSSKDILNEIERNMHDAMNVARNILIDPALCPGGGATEAQVSARLLEKAEAISDVSKYAYKAISDAFLVIPRTLAQNCGANPIRIVTELMAHHTDPKANPNLGLDGNSGKVCDVVKENIWDTCAVKLQIYKSAIEAACMLLRIDDIVSGIKKQGDDGVPKKPVEDFQSNIEE